MPWPRRFRFGIAVLNRFLFPDRRDAHVLKTPGDVVSRSEHAQIEARLGSFVEDLRRLGLDADDLRSKLRNRPMKPVWITPDTDLCAIGARCAACNLVVLCTASGRTSSRDTSSDYVQGAADDSESRACGLDASTFWNHRMLLLSASNDELPEIVKRLLSESGSDGSVETPVTVKSTNISIVRNAAAELLFSNFDVVVSCSPVPNAMLTEKLRSRYIHLACANGKVGSRSLRDQLPELRRLPDILTPASSILVTCSSGRDLAISIVLAIMCMYCDLEGAFDPDRSSPTLSKALIKQRLSWIMMSIPDAAPSRATLQSVNAFLLGGQSDQHP